MASRHAGVQLPVRRVPWRAGSEDLEPLVTREWLVTNGLGGYASGTVAGVLTRRYHGLLVAALPNPLGRTVMLSDVLERLTLADGTVARLGGQELAGRALYLEGTAYLTEFRLEAGLPVWQWSVGGVALEKRVIMPHRQNTVYVIYRLLDAATPVRLELQPAVHFRSYESAVSVPIQDGYGLTTSADRYEITSSAQEYPCLRLAALGAPAALTLREERIGQIHYRVEENRGYAYHGTLWSPGTLSLEVPPGGLVSLVASTEPQEVMRALAPEAALAAEVERRRRLLVAAPPTLRRGVPAELVLAADQFLVTPAGRVADTARAWAVGDEMRTVIAGYHWFTDWGRDTMISLEGLALIPGRHREAGAILRAFAHYVRDGLVPNMFPNGSNEGLYHTADATLWFFHAIDRYVAATGDDGLVDLLLPALTGIVERHLDGTRFGIGRDPADGLLRQGAEGYQLTWMDAKVDGWVVTPRRGKAVEINALWYNALSSAAHWLRQRRGEATAARYADEASRVCDAFNRRFWYAEGGYLFDVVDGPDGDSVECRPNQLLAISLPNPVLDRGRWAAVMQVVEERLLTPVGLRSLAPGSPGYAPKYWGNLRARDAAYHQGTVWAWLIGPWVDAWLRVHPGRVAEARRFLDGLVAHLDDFGVGSVAEIFDADAPYAPRGCIAQAWSVAELLRCIVMTSALGDAPD
ncbi:MAG TPA: amylo-alpha-1,6-glucosidase [Gemmatimonadaceae bacterium]|nr:amylo-alpha-1,6-glucosidase [Gemmatimonadaceae bacterium]